MRNGGRGKSEGKKIWQAPAGRWRAADGATMLAALAASGVGPSAFARSHGVTVQRIAYWRTRFAGRTGSAAAGFVPVRVTEARAACKPPGNDIQVLEFELRNGRRVSVRGRWDRSSVGHWLNALEELEDSTCYAIRTLSVRCTGHWPETRTV